MESIQNVNFDLYILCSADRFHDNDLKIAKFLSNAGKPFYFVRTKFDQDIKGKENKYNETEYNSTQIEILFNETKAIINKRLNADGLTPKNVYIVSSLINKIKGIDNRQKYDFQHLLEEIITNLDDEKKPTLVYALSSLAGIQIARLRYDFIKDSIFTNAIYWYI